MTGALFGLTAGMSPGPLMTLIIAESLRGGWPAGCRVSMAPLITDTVLVTLALLLAAPLPAWGLPAISAAGGAILVWMGWATMRAPGPATLDAAPAAGGPLLKGIATNLVNPHAFLFWLTIGAPIIRDAYGHWSWGGPLAFMGAFFLVMIGFDLMLAFTVSRGRHVLRGPGYRWALRFAGAALALLGLWRFWEGAAGLLGPG